MDDSNQDYYSFQQYYYYRDVYQAIQYDIGNEYDSFPEDIFKERTKYNVSITMDCSRLKKYLIKLDNEKGCKNKNCCKYINYVLNKMVHTYYDSNSSIFYIYNTYMNHKNNNKEIMNLCLKEINYMIPEKYKKINLLYNAYEKCQPYASKEYTSNSCSLANTCVHAYNNIMIEYTKRDDAKFCKALKDLKDFLEKNEPPLTSDCYPIFSVSLFYPYYCNELLKKKEKDNSYIDHPNTELVLLRAVVPGLEKRNSAVGEPEDGTDTEERATSVGTIIGTSLGIVLPLIVIYRFTPLSNWVNTKILGRDKLMDNMKKNERELLLNSEHPRDINSGDTIYRIKYNSVLNE